MLAIVLMTLRAFALARRRIAEADTIAHGSDDPTALANAALVRGWIEFVTGALDDAQQSMQQAAAAFESIGDMHGWSGASCLLYWIFYCKADFAALATLAADMVRIGQDAGDPYLTYFGQDGLGLLALTAGPLDEAAMHLSAACDVAARISSFRCQAGTGGLLGKCRLRQGRLTEAAAVLTAAIGLIEAKHLRGEWSADPLNAFAELCLVNVDRLSGAPRRTALRTASRACAQALRCTRDAATWLPETLRLHGTLAWLSGNTPAAQGRWRKSLATAEGLGMVVERARTLLEMGSRLGDVSLIDEATGVFAQTGARVDLAFSVHARAKMATASGADAGSALQRYDQAIALLDEVQAEYALGVACRQRARLHEQTGHLDLARTDLAQARRCFTAVGAATEQAEAEQETIALGTDGVKQNPQSLR
jgi:tetratricopeptide (TPR) repeat protein